MACQAAVSRSRIAASASAGVFQPSVLRGRPFSSSATAASSAGVCPARDVPLGKYWRSSPLVFSLLPRCQGACGSQKKISQSASTAICACARISQPWSQASDRRSASGSPAITGVSASATAAASRPAGSGTSIVNRVARSTSVPPAVSPAAPPSRPPPQCPGTARSAASAGRSLIITIPGIFPRRSPPARRGLRSAPPVRRLARSSPRRAPPPPGRARLAQRPPGPQARRQLPPQRPPALHIQRLVDRLVRHPHLRPARELQSQPRAHLLRRPLPIQLAVTPAAQFHVPRERSGLRPRPPQLRQRLLPHRPVPPGRPVPRHLPADRRGRPPDPRPDHPVRLLPRQPQRDLLPLRQRQVPPRHRPRPVPLPPPGHPEPAPRPIRTTRRHPRIPRRHPRPHQIPEPLPHHPRHLPAPPPHHTHNDLHIRKPLQPPVESAAF